MQCCENSFFNGLQISNFSILWAVIILIKYSLEAELKCLPCNFFN